MLLSFLPRRPAARGATILLTSLLALAGCGGGSSDSDAKASTVEVKAGDKSCEVATASLPAGTHRFAVTNTGSQITEVYVYGEGDRIVGEVEDVGPGTSRDLTVELAAGNYQVACKPGMQGTGIRSALTVSAGAASSPTS